MPVYKSETPTKDGRCYYFQVNYTDNNGKYKKYNSKKYATKKECQKAEAAFMIDVGKTAGGLSKTFNQILDEFETDKKKTLKPTTFKRLVTMSDHIRKNLGTVRIEKMTKQQYELFRHYLDNTGFTPSYKNKINWHLKAVLKYAYNKYDILNNIPNKYPSFSDPTAPVKEMDFYTLAEFKQFISAVDDVRYHALFTTLFYMGLRIGEANALTWKDVDFEANEIRITKTVHTRQDYLITTPKTKSSIRTLPMPRIVSNALSELHDYYFAFEGFSPLWACFGGLRALPDSSISKAKSDYARKAGIREIRLHDFRHSCASLLINHGANITLVSKYLGHSDIKMTLNTYSHFYKSKLEELVQAIDNL